MTKIAWVRREDTVPVSWNVTTGCSPISAGCRNCYAAGIAVTRLKHHPRYAGLANDGGDGAFWTGEVRCHDELLAVPLRWRKPHTVFVDSMSDLFHDGVPSSFIQRVFAVAHSRPEHTFLFLTKRPERMATEVELFLCFSQKERQDPPANVWLGTTVENGANFGRVDELLKCPAALRFLSLEPLLGPIHIPMDAWPCYDSGEDIPPEERGEWGLPARIPGIDWVIVGAETGPHARPMELEWAMKIQEQCRDAGVPFFFKQGPKGVVIPAELCVREFPR